MNLIDKAKEFASRAHRNHTLQNEAKTPYIVHLTEVAKLVEDSGGTEEEIVAAWLHDTVEDTEVTMEDIRETFGDTVGDMVEGLTDFPEWETLPLGERKAKQAERVLSASESIRRVKLADQTSNVTFVGTTNCLFTVDTRVTYVQGTKPIAEACSDISPFLDELFSERYKEAILHLQGLQESV